DYYCQSNDSRLSVLF
nr:immunoglobulin light chain junction region [Macaca mulatta]MOX80345.1 immunoglobulin light chain junction region [Macaca mulatta]